jgi:hypothetical protein
MFKINIQQIFEITEYSLRPNLFDILGSLWSPILFGGRSKDSSVLPYCRSHPRFPSHTWIKEGKKAPIKLKPARGHLISFLADNSTEEVDALVSVKFAKV